MLYIQKKTVGVVSICMGIFNAEPAAVCARLAVTTVAMHVHSYSNGSIRVHTILSSRFDFDNAVLFFQCIV